MQAHALDPCPLSGLSCGAATVKQQSLRNEQAEWSNPAVAAAAAADWQTGRLFTAWAIYLFWDNLRNLRWPGPCKSLCRQLNEADTINSLIIWLYYKSVFFFFFKRSPLSDCCPEGFSFEVQSQAYYQQFFISDMLNAPGMLHVYYLFNWSQFNSDTAGALVPFDLPH